jgi:hypothetical protein
MKQLLFCLAAMLLSLGALSQDVVVKVQPLPYLKFENPPFESGGKTYVPLEEVAKVLPLSDEARTKILAEAMVMPEKTIIDGKPRHIGIIFVPARTIADELKDDISKIDNWLTIGDSIWKIDGKIIVISLIRQHVNFYEGFKPVHDCRTSTGMPGFETPIGIFKVYKKIRGYHKVVGKPWHGTMYNPVYFDVCAALHGSSLMPRKTSSHGCCHLYNSDADWLYAWAPIGATVYVVP